MLWTVIEAAEDMLFPLLWQGQLSWYIAKENSCLIVAFVLYRSSTLKSRLASQVSLLMYHAVSLGAINI